MQVTKLYLCLCIHQILNEITLKVFKYTLNYVNFHLVFVSFFLKKHLINRFVKNNNYIDFVSNYKTNYNKSLFTANTFNVKSS